MLVALFEVIRVFFLRGNTDRNSESDSRKCERNFKIVARYNERDSVVKTGVRGLESRCSRVPREKRANFAPAMLELRNEKFVDAWEGEVNARTRKLRSSAWRAQVSSVSSLYI